MQPRNPLKKIHQLLRAENVAAGAPLRVTNDAGNEAHIYLYDVIDPFWGISAEAFAKTLSGISAETVHLHINSPGGDVFEARAMVAAIKSFPGLVMAHIDGLAASAASYIALAANEVRMTDGAFFMIHNAWTIAFGNATDLRATADLLDKVDASIVADYRKKTGKDEATIQGWMAAETWFTAQEALDNGFIDAIDGGEAAPVDQWNVAAFDKAPEALVARTNKITTQAELDRLTAETRAHTERHFKLLETCSN